nr:MAG TPA: hypothetical protein [Bacteriophage sp.]
MHYYAPFGLYFCEFTYIYSPIFELLNTNY